ncbi:MAG: hypothetical protein IH958_04280 [Chloroflexi bacterium]|nr:hypothetical protein [Chloroflexota bacterium]
MTTLETPVERARPPRDAMPPLERCPTCGADVPEGFRFCGQCGRALAATLAPAPGDLLTIVFTDLVGFSAFSSWAEAEELRTLIRAYHSLVREQMSRYSGFEVKQTGDGFMIAFASPGRAVQCAAGVQQAMAAWRLDQQIKVRVGLNSGDAIREGNDFFGHMVNLASRIAGRAGGGQVFASEATRVIAGNVEGVRFVDIGRRRLRGIRGRHRLYEIVWWE